MITLTNKIRKIKINERKLKADATSILKALGYPDFDLGILITNNKTIREYNRDFRKKDKPTDVLSFPFYPSLKAGERIKATSPDGKNLGDLIFSLEYIKKAAVEWDQSLEERLQVLLVHGICHLLGYDHIEDEDYKVMQAQENKILKLLKG
jgi:rRNA maturation RNase YbeY